MSKIQCEYNIFCVGCNQVTELHKSSFRSHNLIIVCSPDQLGATLSVKCQAQASGLLKFKITTRWTCHTIFFPYCPLLIAAPFLKLLIFCTVNLPQTVYRLSTDGGGQSSKVAAFLFINCETHASPTSFDAFSHTKSNSVTREVGIIHEIMPNKAAPNHLHCTASCVPINMSWCRVAEVADIGQQWVSFALSP